jgi:hypothetical protein
MGKPAWTLPPIKVIAEFKACYKIDILAIMIAE